MQVFDLKYTAYFAGLLLAVLLVPPVQAQPVPPTASAWNPAQIAWRHYNHGMKEAKRTGKPILMVFHTTWCPYCKQYRKVFFNPRVVATAKKMVLIMVDRDKEPAISRRYALEGPNKDYVPRSVFFAPSGKPDPALKASGPNAYLLNTGSAYLSAELTLNLMNKAIAKHSAVPPAHGSQASPLGSHTSPRGSHTSKSAKPKPKPKSKSTFEEVFGN